MSKVKVEVTRSKMSGVIKLMFLGVISIGIYLLAYEHFNPPRQKVSIILLQMEKYLERLIALDLKTSAMLAVDPFADLVEQVRPLVDTLGHISAQTRVYEGMERIPGGPQSFMTPSLVTLDELQTELHLCENRYRLIVAGMNRNISVIINRHQALHTDFISIFGDTEVVLQDYKIYMTPQDEQEPLVTTTPHAFLQLISDLRKYYAEFEELIQGVDVLDMLQGKVKISTPDEARLAMAIHGITVEHGDTTFPQIGFLWTQKMKDINRKMDDITDHLNRMKKRYEDLADGVDMDIVSTKERVRNLANVNAKKIEL